MIVSSTTTPEKPPLESVEARREVWWQPIWARVALLAVMLVSIFMNFYQLGQDGYANSYYAAGIRSMLDSWHNFFFVAFDPGGFVTIDKPPLGFWLQAASAKIFGFSPLSLFLPQALAGVLSVLLLYYLVRRHFGLVAGLLAALALAISPISVVTNRNNTIDSTLILLMLLGAWAVIRAAESGKLRWLLLCAVFVGLGFNVKMLEAYLVVPAYGLLYLLAAPRRIWVRVAHLALAALLMVVLSLSWVVAVDLTPASQRPYVGSSQDNSELSLAIGYNGVQRLLGSFGFGGSGTRNTTTGSTTTQQAPTGTGGRPSFDGFPGGERGAGGGQPPQGFGGGGGGTVRGGGGGGGTAGTFNTGNPSVLRLFSQPLGGQIVWLVPFALLGILALAWQRRPKFRADREQQSLVLWGVWLLVVGIFFSAASFFHQYYLSTLAPAICALFGIGVAVMWRDYSRAGWRGWLLPLALLLTAAEQIYIIMSDSSWGTWLIPLIAVPCILGAVVLFVARLFPGLRLNRRMLVPALGLALAGLMIVSAVWSAVPAVQNIAQDLPIAGSSQQAGGFGGGSTSGTGNTALVRYLEANQGSSRYLVAVASSNEADSLILTTNKPVMALGGFSGSDPILMTSELATLVKDGTVRFFLLGGGGGGGQSSLSSWVTQHCSSVSSSTIGSSSTNGGGQSSQLYDCKSAS